MRQHQTSDEALEAVSNANAHLNNAGLPTLADLDQALMAGAGVVLASPGEYHPQFVAGWRAAMEHVYARMSATILAERERQNAEQLPA